MPVDPASVDPTAILVPTEPLNLILGGDSFSNIDGAGVFEFYIGITLPLPTILRFLVGDPLLLGLVLSGLE